MSNKIWACIGIAITCGILLLPILGIIYDLVKGHPVG